MALSKMNINTMVEHCMEKQKEVDELRALLDNLTFTRPKRFKCKSCSWKFKKEKAYLDKHLEISGNSFYCWTCKHFVILHRSNPRSHNLDIHKMGRKTTFRNLMNEFHLNIYYDTMIVPSSSDESGIDDDPPPQDNRNFNMDFNDFEFD